MQGNQSPSCALLPTTNPTPHLPSAFPSHDNTIGGRRIDSTPSPTDTERTRGAPPRKGDERKGRIGGAGLGNNFSRLGGREGGRRRGGGGATRAPRREASPVKGVYPSIHSYPSIDMQTDFFCVLHARNKKKQNFKKDISHHPEKTRKQKLYHHGTRTLGCAKHKENTQQRKKQIRT